jgi:DNA-binding MarR family transcriptional regulator
MNASSILETLYIANHRLTRLTAQATGSPVSSAVWTTLSVLSTQGAHRIGDLARAVRISQPGMTKILQNLVEDEWVYRIADTEDSRAWLIAITPRGSAALLDWHHELTRAMEPVFADLTAEDWRVLERAGEILSSHVATVTAAA